MPSAPLRRLSLLGLAALLSACSKPEVPPATAAAPVPVRPAAPRVVASTVCDLITDQELGTVFAGAASVEPEHHTAFGIVACEWNGPFGRLLLQQWPSKGHTPQDEVRDLVSGFVDPGKPGASARIRLMPLQDLGNFATAVVESRDPGQGVLADIAVLSIARDGQTLVFLTDGLDGLEREAALAKLHQLGRYAYARL